MENLRVDECNEQEGARVISISIPAKSPIKRETGEEGKLVNCLFCYEPVRKFDGSQAKAIRGLMVKTSERLFGYVVKHLEFEGELEELQMTRKSKKEGKCRLLPGNLPLCIGCKEKYYQKMYDAFVEYELAMDKLNELIAACVTKAVATSARTKGGSVEGQEMFGDGDEHEVMKLVKRFRSKVVEKNPTGWTEGATGNLTGSVSSTGATAAVPSTSGASSSPAPVGIQNVINVVKTSLADTFKTPEDREKETCERLKQVKNDPDEPSSASSDKNKPMKYYAVAEPSPGVIQIIPMTNPITKVQKRKRREPEYLERRLQQNTCKFCNKFFTNSLMLTKHMVAKHGMEKPEKCPKCEYRCVDKQYMARHMETHLEHREMRFQCEECGKQFTHQNPYKAHLKKMHSANRQTFMCEICGKVFNNSSSRQFCLDKHNGIKNFQCSFAGCDKRFLRKQVLQIHERTHTGEKPHKCEMCGKCFSQRTPLANHLKNVHNYKTSKS